MGRSGAPGTCGAPPPDWGGGGGPRGGGPLGGGPRGGAPLGGAPRGAPGGGPRGGAPRLCGKSTSESNVLGNRSASKFDCYTALCGGGPLGTPLGGGPLGGAPLGAPGGGPRGGGPRGGGPRPLPPGPLGGGPLGGAPLGGGPRGGGPRGGGPRGGGPRGGPPMVCSGYLDGAVAVSYVDGAVVTSRAALRLACLLSAGQPSRSQRNSGHGRLRSSRDRTKSVQAATMACPGVRAEKLSSQRLSCQSKLAPPPPEKRANEAYHSSLLRARRGGRVQAESGGRKPDLTKALKSMLYSLCAAPTPLALLP